MKTKRVLCFIFTLAAMMIAGRAALAQETLQYDDGTADGSYATTAGDIEYVAFRPEHPCRITGISIWFTGTPAATDVYIWADFGESGLPFGSGETPDPLFESTITPEVDVWTEITLTVPVTLDPPKRFLVGQVLGSDGLQIAHDGSAPAEGQEHSLFRLGGDWYLAGGADFMVRADVEYFDVVDTPSFTDVTISALGGASPRRVAWGDYDGDGDDDLLVNGPRLWHNDDGTFTDVSIEAGIRNAGDERICGGSGGIWADYDNDGHLDFYSTSSSFVALCTPGEDDWYCNDFSGGEVPHCVDGYCHNEGADWPAHDCLFHNEGDGTFTVPPEEGMPYDYSPSEGAGWGDYDGDGFVDLYVANYEMPGSWTGGSLGVGTPDILWRNNGDGTFTDVSETSLPGDEGTGCRWQSGRGVNWGDYDDDGLIDIFVSNYRLQPNCLWHNLGDGTFDEVAEASGVQGVRVSSSYGHTIGSQWMDFDNDGDLDLFSANLAHPRFISFSDKSMLLLNSGSPGYLFANEWEERGFLYQETDSEPAWGDFDNDGLPDIYITDVYVGRVSELYRQLPDGTFEDVTYETGTTVDNGWGAAWSDYDGDGDLDLVSTRLLRNDEVNDNHWLEVSLEGTDSNRAAIGARVDVTCGGVTRSRQVEGGKGTTNQNSLTLHFGLGNCTLASEMVVRWPSGLVETYTDVEVDQRLDIVEGDTLETPDEDEEPAPDASTDAGTDDGPSDGGGKGCGCVVVG